MLPRAFYWDLQTVDLTVVEFLFRRRPFALCFRLDAVCDLAISCPIDRQDRGGVGLRQGTYLGVAKTTKTNRSYRRPYLVSGEAGLALACLNSQGRSKAAIGTM